MSEFKVGDLVTGIEDSFYVITNKDSVCKVTSKGLNNHFEVKLISTQNPEHTKEIGKTFIVQKRLFTKINPKQTVETRILVWNGEQEKVKFIFNGDMTICILPDGTKGIAKKDPKDTYVKEYGLLLSYERARYNQLYGSKKVNKTVKVTVHYPNGDQTYECVYFSVSFSPESSIGKIEAEFNAKHIKPGKQVLSNWLEK